MLPYKLEPWKHQRVATETATPRNEYALFFEMGTGKTATAINILRNWSAIDKELRTTLILCPPIVIDQWAEEFTRHSNIPSQYIVKLKGTGAKRLKTLQENIGHRRIFITNYETLLMDKVFDIFKVMPIKTAIFDESHKLKSITAKRTKRSIELADGIDRRLILTGSPILNTPMDIFSQFRILDGGETFGHNFFVFRARYFYDANAGMPKHRYFPNWKPRADCFEKINELVYTKAMRVKKDDCLDLPPLVRQEISVDLSKEQRKAYEEMQKDLVTYLGSAAAVAQMALTKTIRLQQIVSGFVSLDDESQHTFKDCPRVKVLEELLDQLVPEHKVIIWASYHNDYRRIADVLSKMGVGFTQIHGLCSASEKQQAVESFRDDPKCRVVIANQKAGGVGVGLQAASYAIYYSRGYSLEDDLQSEARNHRGGSEVHQKITRIDLVAKGTIDEIVLGALKRKQNIADNILALREQLGLV